jgi:hypothetical protein
MELIDGGTAAAVLPVSAAVDPFLGAVSDGALNRVSDADLLAEVRELERLRRRLAAADHAVISELDRRGLAATLAMRTTPGLLQGLLRLSPHEARRNAASTPAASAARGPPSPARSWTRCCPSRPPPRPPARSHPSMPR